jgi:hypothetical protein
MQQNHIQWQGSLVSPVTTSNGKYLQEVLFSGISSINQNPSFDFILIDEPEPLFFTLSVF